MNDRTTDDTGQLPSLRTVALAAAGGIVMLAVTLQILVPNPWDAFATTMTWTAGAVIAAMIAAGLARTINVNGSGEIRWRTTNGPERSRSWRFGSDHR